MEHDHKKRRTDERGKREKMGLEFALTKKTTSTRKVMKNKEERRALST